MLTEHSDSCDDGSNEAQSDNAPDQWSEMQICK